MNFAWLGFLAVTFLEIQHNDHTDPRSGGQSPDRKECRTWQNWAPASQKPPCGRGPAGLGQQRTRPSLMSQVEPRPCSSTSSWDSGQQNRGALTEETIPSRRLDKEKIKGSSEENLKRQTRTEALRSHPGQGGPGRLSESVVM